MDLIAFNELKEKCNLLEKEMKSLTSRLQPEFLRPIMDEEIQSILIKNNKSIIKLLTQEIQENISQELNKSFSEKKSEKNEASNLKNEKRNSQISTQNTNSSSTKPFPLKKSMSQHVSVNPKKTSKPTDSALTSKSLRNIVKPPQKQKKDDSLEISSTLIKSVNSEYENEEDSSNLPDRKNRMNIQVLEGLEKVVEKGKELESSKPNVTEDRIGNIEKRMKAMEENLAKKVLDFKMKRKAMQKSLQIIEKVDQQQSQSDEDLNLIWKTINTIVMNSKAYFDDVRKEMEQKIQDFKHEVTGLLNFDDLRDVIDELKRSNLDELLTNNKCKTMIENLRRELTEKIDQNNEMKFKDASLEYQKLSQLIEKEKLDSEVNHEVLEHEIMKKIGLIDCNMKEVMNQYFIKNNQTIERLEQGFQDPIKELLGYKDRIIEKFEKISADIGSLREDMQKPLATVKSIWETFNLVNERMNGYYH